MELQHVRPCRHVRIGRASRRRNLALALTLAVAFALVQSVGASAQTLLVLEGGTSNVSRGATAELSAETDRRGEIGLRIGSARPNAPRPDLAITYMDSFVSGDLDLSMAFPLGDRVLLAPRAGGSVLRPVIGSGYLRGWNVGAGVTTKLTPSFGLRLDLTQRWVRYNLETDEWGGRSVRVSSVALGVGWTPGASPR